MLASLDSIPYKVDIDSETTKHKIKMIKEEAGAAQRNAKMRERLYALDNEGRKERRQILDNLNVDEHIVLNQSLRARIIELFEALSTSPPTETMLEINTYSPFHGTWRELEIEELGRLDIECIKDPDVEGRIIRYGLSLGDLPIVEGWNRSERGLMLVHRPDQAIPHHDSTYSENYAMLDHVETLEVISRAANLID